MTDLSNSSYGHCERKDISQEQERRDKILEAAMHLLCEKGYQYTTMEDIACKSGMSKKTLYLLFSSKEMLLERLLLEKLFSPLNIAPIKCKTIHETLVALMFQISQKMLSEQVIELLRIIIIETKRFPDIQHLMQDIFHLSGRKFDVHNWLIEQRTQGYMRFDDLDEVIDHLFGLTLAIPVLKSLTHCAPPRDEQSLYHFITEGVRVFLAGYYVGENVGERIENRDKI